MIEFTLDELTHIEKALLNAENDLTNCAFGDDELAGDLGQLADRINDYVTLERSLTAPTPATPQDEEDFWTSFNNTRNAVFPAVEGCTCPGCALECDEFETSQDAEESIEPRIYDTEGRDITDELTDDEYRLYVSKLPVAMRSAYIDARFGVAA